MPPQALQTVQPQWCSSAHTPAKSLHSARFISLVAEPEGTVAQQDLSVLFLPCSILPRGAVQREGSLEMKQKGKIHRAGSKHT